MDEKDANTCLNSLLSKYNSFITAILGTDKWSLTVGYNKDRLPYDRGDKPVLGEYILKLHGGAYVSGFTLKEMIGCCGICVSTGAWVHDNYQKRGLGSLLNKLRQDLAREMGYSVLLCTDRLNNKPQRKLLNKAGWEDVYEFTNSRTNNRIAISVIPLTRNANGCKASDNLSS